MIINILKYKNKFWFIKKYMLRQISSAFQKYSFAVEKKLFVSDPQRFDPANESGVRATVFGPSGTFNLS